MNSRERTFKTLEGKVGDRLPIDFWATSTVARKIEAEYGKSYADFLEDYDVDFRYIKGPEYIGPPLEEGVDIWGVKRTSVSTGATEKSESYNEVTKPPLSDATCTQDIENYDHWPNPDMFDYNVIEQQCDEVLGENRVVVFSGDRLNRVAQLKPAMYLRGTENIFVDLAINPGLVETLLRKIRNFYLAYLERILRAAKGKIDIVLTGDDFGAQHGLLFSPEMWRDFLKPGFREYINLIKSYDTLAMHHTCGSVVDILPDLIECDLDILQSLQPEANGMSPTDLKKKFGKSISFQGGISIQQTMPHGSQEDIQQEVRQIAEVAKQDGGYIFCTAHNIQANTPVENIIALMDAYLEYGRQDGGAIP